MQTAFVSVIRDKIALCHLLRIRWIPGPHTKRDQPIILHVQIITDDAKGEKLSKTFISFGVHKNGISFNQTFWYLVSNGNLMAVKRVISSIYHTIT